MGISHEINGNNCHLSPTTQLTALSNCGETLVLAQSSVPAMPHLMAGLDLNALNAFNNTFNALDLNQSLIINTNELSTDSTTQQILIVSSPMDLMAVPQPQQSMITKSAQQPVQMVIQTTDMPMMSSGAPVSVIQVPTNLLLTDNNLIVIPQEGLTLEVPAIENLPAQQTIDGQLNFDNKNQTTIVYNGSPQLLTTGQQIQYTNGEQLVINLNDCIAINAIEDKTNANQYFPANHQIIGIIDGNTSEPKLLATEQIGDDLNAFLASSMTTAVEPECDPNVAKAWLSDSLIAYRALTAFKKVMPNSTASPTSGLRINK